jgi:hypothetical protein
MIRGDASRRFDRCMGILDPGNQRAEDHDASAAFVCRVHDFRFLTLG